MIYRITLAYDGTNYFGWQFQPELRTIQGALNAALEKAGAGNVTIHAAGRTDAGVHAEGQVASFQLNREWQGTQLQKALNCYLPWDIRVMQAERAADDFHARFNVKSKTYRYRVFTGNAMNPLWTRYAWHHPYRLDDQKLIDDSRVLLGSHDFTAFTVAACDKVTRVRTVTEIRLEREGDLLTFYFSGKGFLRYQVRTMTAALVEVNRGRLKAGSLPELIESRNRQLIGAPAPAQGLTLMKVEY